MVAHKAKKVLATSVKKAEKATVRMKHHYWNVMPAKKRHRIFIWVAFLSVSAVMGWQIAYPPDRGLPLASINGSIQANRSYDEMAKGIVEKFDQTKITLSVDGVKKLEFDLKVTGAEPNTDTMITRMSDYPFWQRFIPG